VKTRAAASAGGQPLQQRGAAAVAKTSDTHPVTPRVDAVPRPQIRLEGTPQLLRPTVFVGIGGLAGRILLRLRRRLSSAGGDNQLPALPVLYLDTDANSIGAVSSNNPGGGLGGAEVLALPLHDSNYYRNLSSNVLDWLSRRWLFNIPRSRNVEGMRPLGRLAFVDHQQAIRARLEERLAQATSAEAVRATAERLHPAEGDAAPHVFIVASISGGTGAGAALDAGYLARHILQGAGHAGGRVTGMLLHATGQRDQASRIQRANALACLSEFQRFSIPQLGFPGAPSCHVPASDLPPFDDTYLVHLGDHLSDADFEAGAEGIAEYLFQQSVSPACEFFDQCRTADRAKTTSLKAGPRLRTVGIARMESSHDETRRHEADALCQGLIRLWQQGATLHTEGRPSRTPAVRDTSGSLLGRLELDVEKLVRKAMAVSRGSIARQVEAFFRTRLEGQFAGDAGSAADVKRLLHEIDCEFSLPPSEGMQAGHPARVLQVVREQLGHAARRAAQSACTEMLAAADRSENRLATACESFSDVLHQLGETKNALIELRTRTADDLRELVRGAAGANRDDTTSADPTHQDTADSSALCLTYAAHRFCGRALQLLVEHVEEIRAGLRALCGALAARFAAVPEEGSLEAVDRPDAELLLAFNERLRGRETVKLQDWLAVPAPSSGIPAGLENAARAFLLERGLSTGGADGYHQWLVESKTADGSGRGRPGSLYRSGPRDRGDTRQPGRTGRRGALLRSRKSEGLGPRLRHQARPGLRFGSTN
jgi:hypothetical protein